MMMAPTVNEIFARIELEKRQEKEALALMWTLYNINEAASQRATNQVVAQCRSLAVNYRRFYILNESPVIQKIIDLCSLDRIPAKLILRSIRNVLKTAY